MADAARNPSSGFSGRLLGMKFMQRAQKLVEHADMEAVGEETRQDDAQVELTPNPGTTVHNRKRRCVVDSAVYNSRDTVLTSGRRSFAHSNSNQVRCAALLSLATCAQAHILA